MAFAVSATQESISAALAWGADALVVHHGVFWKHQGAKAITGPWGKRLTMAIRAELNLFAYHLPLDAHLEVGNAVGLLRALGAESFSPFAPYKRQHLGASARLNSPIKARDLAEKLSTLLQRPCTSALADENQLISTVGVVTGGANNEWVEAQRLGLDAYITGEMSEYNWHDAREAGVAFFAAGHHATERFGVQQLMARVKAQWPSVEVNFFDSQNPA